MAEWRLMVRFSVCAVKWEVLSKIHSQQEEIKKTNNTDDNIRKLRYWGDDRFRAFPLQNCGLTQFRGDRIIARGPAA